MKKSTSFIIGVFLTIVAFFCIAPSIVVPPPSSGGSVSISLTNRPVEFTVSSRGIRNGLSAITNNGANFGPDTPGTTSSGMQEALNAIPRGTNFGPWASGAALRLDAGYFFYTNALFFSNVFTSGIKITGAGRLDTKLVYAGSATGTNCFTLKGGGNTNADAQGPGGKTIDLPLHVILRDIGFSAINETTNILCCITNDSYIEVSRCLFTSWNIMTNQVWGSAVSITGTGYTNAQGLVGLVVGSLLDFHVSVDDCFFIGLADGVVGYADHFYTKGLVTAMVGTCGDALIRNLWPTNHPYALGAAIIVGRTDFNVYCDESDFYSAHIGIAVLPTATNIEVYINDSEWEGIDSPLAMIVTNAPTFFLKGHTVDFQTGTYKIATGDYTSLSPCPAKVRTAIYDNPATFIGGIDASQLTSGTLPDARLTGVGTAGTYRSVTTDAKGRVTAGSNPTTFSGYGISDTVANLATALSDETTFGLAALQANGPIVTNQYTLTLTLNGQVIATNTFVIGTNSLPATNQFLVSVATNAVALGIHTNSSIYFGAQMIPQTSPNSAGNSTAKPAYAFGPGATNTGFFAENNSVICVTIGASKKLQITVGTIMAYNQDLMTGVNSKIGWGIGDGSPETYFYRPTLGNIVVTNNFTATGTITATNSFASYKNNTAANTSITVGASPFNYTNTTGLTIFVDIDANGSTTAVARNGTTIFGSLVNGDHEVILKPNGYLTVTYSIATPIMGYTEQ